MTLRCLLGFHQISLSSIMRRNEGYSGLCERCARPLERRAEGRWVPAEPLDRPRDKAA